MRLALVFGILLLLTSGCYEPFRVHVPAAILDESEIDWVEERKGEVSGGAFGANTKETRYTFDPDQEPPFPAILQVFSIRGANRHSTNELLDLVSDLIDEAIDNQSISLDAGENMEGSRSLESGVSTKWVYREGRVEEDGPIFDEDVEVRIIGEVGYDGKSSTSFLIVGLAQVERTLQGPLGLPGQTQYDPSAWISIAGDEAGTIKGATSSLGLIDNLVTHG